MLSELSDVYVIAKAQDNDQVAQEAAYEMGLLLGGLAYKTTDLGTNTAASLYAELSPTERGALQQGFQSGLQSSEQYKWEALVEGGVVLGVTARRLVTGATKINNDKDSKLLKDFVADERGVLKLGPSQGEKQRVSFESGCKGGWCKELNNPKPNTIYTVDNQTTYETDALGRVVTAKGHLNPVPSDSADKDMLQNSLRNVGQQSTVGRSGQAQDQGGHLIATMFGGAGERINLLPMHQNLNTGAWLQMERTWKKALDQGKKVEVKIRPIYQNNNSRPEKVEVDFTIDGVLEERFFKNE